MRILIAHQLMPNLDMRAISRNQEHLMHRKFRIIASMLLFFALVGMQPPLMAESPQLSVLELPAVEGSDEPQVAVKWSGELPASLQYGYEDGRGHFVPTSSSIELTNAMTLLPQPAADTDLELSWRILDAQGQVLEKSRGDSIGAGWQPTFYGPGLDGGIYATTIYDGNLVVAGSFLTAGGEEVNRIARWDGSHWTSLTGPSGTGLEGGIVYALSVYNGEVIAGGRFNMAGGVAVNQIARWDGNGWASLDGPSGSGVAGGYEGVRALIVNDGELIVGGHFTSAGGIATNGIASWNGSQWAKLDGPSGSGVNGRVYALGIYNDDLIVGGAFNSAGGLTADNIARWDGSQWAALHGSSGGGLSSRVHALAIYDDDLIAGGQFVYADGMPVNRIARWDGNDWYGFEGPSGTGVNATVNALAVYNGELIAGGLFGTAGGVTVLRIARWNGSQWASLDGPSGTGVSGSVTVVTVFNSDLIAGGAFSTAGGEVVNYIARWNSSEWAAISGTPGGGVLSAVYAMTIYNGELIAAGFLRIAGGVTVNHIARWDGSEWASLDGPTGSGMNNTVLALTVYDGELIAGGYFTSAGGVPVNYIARWDGSEWAALAGPSSTGVNYRVRALTVYNGELIAGGLFSSAGGVAVNRVARWDGSQWDSLAGPSGMGVDGAVHSLAVYSDELIVGGGFTNAGGLLANRIARWNGSEWGSLEGPSGVGMNSLVEALTVYNDELIAGGVFSDAGGVQANRIARWDGTQWADLSSPTESGLNNRVYALNVYDGELIAGGDFSNAAGVTVNRIASWDGSEWGGLDGPSGIGMDNTVRALTIHNEDLFAGGIFSVAGGIASWRIGQFVTAYSVGGTVSGLAGNGLTLQNNGSDDLLVSANESFSFPTPIANGGSYEISVLFHPEEPSQTCSVNNSSGTVLGSDVDDVQVTCATNTFSIGGTVSDLAGTGLVLQNNAGDDLAISSDGSFEFATALLDGTNYDVTVAVQPTNLSQTCTVANGSGTLAGTDVTNVEVTCATDQFTVGGTVSGLQGDQVVLQNNAGDDQTLSADGGFTFSPQDDGTTYEVTVLTQPDDPSQTCSVSNGSGDLAGADFTGVEVVCVTDQFSVGGSVSGLVGNGLVLQNNGGDDLPISEDGSFTFSTALDDLSGYEVTVLAQPSDPSQTCTVSNGTGDLAGADVIDVDVTCTTDSYTVATTATNGTITSAIDPVVEWGQTTVVTGQSDANHYFASVEGCNGTQQTNSDQSITDFSYETGAIEADCTVSAEFSIRTYTMSSTVSSGQGTIDVLTPVVEHGSDADYEVTPDTGWSLQSFTGDTCTPTDNGDGTWTATAIAADCEVTAEFIEDSTTVLVTSMSPAIVGIPVTYTISVTGTASAPADGQVELVSDLDGVICNLASVDSTSGQTAVFSCQHTWNAVVEHQLSAAFSDSDTHGDSNDGIQQQVAADEDVFHDRFKGE
jgi:trimeric autotransporter adhesin